MARATKGVKMEEVRAEMVKNWKTAWDNYVNMLTAMHGQGEKALDLYCSETAAQCT